MRQTKSIFFPFKNVLLWIIFVILSIPTITEAQIQWVNNGIHIASATATQVHLCAVPDGNGGTFITYEDNPTDNIDIYAQWIDGSGILRWGPSGVVVNASIGNQRYPSVVKDNTGGVFVAWHDESTGDINVQHLDNSGTILWETQGKPVCSATGEQSLVKMVSDGSGGAILVWIDKRNGANSDLYAQRIDHSGNFLWTEDGIPVTTASGNQSSHVIIGDGSGGVFVVWQDDRDVLNKIDIYAQRITPSGTQDWSVDGAVVISRNNDQIFPAADTSGNKLIISWEDYRSGNSDIYAQALDFNGNRLWMIKGIAVCEADENQFGCRVTSDCAGSAIITWWDKRSGDDIYAQRLNQNGWRYWQADGIVVNQSPGYQYMPDIISDGSGGALIVWSDNRSGSVSDINVYGQYVSGAGELMWPEDGFPLVTEEEKQQNPILVADESGGAIILWQDERSEKGGIYAQLVNENLSFTEPQSEAFWAGNQQQTIQWSLRTPKTRFDHLTIRASSFQGDGFPHMIAQDIDPLQYGQIWTPNTINSSNVRIKIQARDAQNFILCEFVSEEFTIDSEPPEIFDLLNPSDGAFVELNPTFEWESTTDNLSGFDYFELWIDEDLVEDSLETTTYTLTKSQELTPAKHTWTVNAVDKAGFVRQASSTWTFTAAEDQNPPNPFHLLSPANNAWSSESNPTFSWEQTFDTGTGLKKYQLYIDDQLRIDNISPPTTTTSGLTMSQGIYSWYIVAVDSNQNSIRSTETWIIKVDNVPPVNFNLSQPGDKQWICNTTPTFTWQATLDSGIGLWKYQLWIDDNLTIDNISAANSSVTLPADQALEQGTHTWFIVAKDILENSCSSQDIFTLKIDTEPPDSFSLIEPEDESYITQPSPEFTWESTTDNASGLKEYELWIDNSLSVDGLQMTSSPPGSPLSQGPHTWSVHAVDNAENTTTTSVFNFVADWTPPETFALAAPSYNEILHINRPAFVWRSTTDHVSGFDKFQLFIDGVIKKDSISVQDTSITLSIPFENGIHYWQVWVWDKAGNYRISDNFYFTIDCNPPQITSSGSATATEDIPFSYVATATDPDKSELTITFHNYPSWLIPSGNQISGTPTEGVQDTSFLVIVEDGIFSDSLEVILTVEAVNDPPLITSAGSAIATEDITFSYTATATDPEKDAMTFIFSQYPVWLTTVGNQITGTPGEGTQDTSFLIIVTDGLLADTLNVLVTVTSVNDYPVITSSDTATAIEDVPFTYTASATDPDTNELTYIFDQFPIWLTPFGNKISGTPTEGTQDTSFVVIASDGSLADTVVVQVNVILVNESPVITSPDTATVMEDSTFSYTATAIDPEKDELIFTIEKYPTWLTPSGDHISGIPTEGKQDTSFVVIVSDGSLTDTLVVKLNVIPINDPPIITSPDTINATEETHFVYTATATDPEKDTITFQYIHCPSWLYPSENLICGTAKEGQKDTSFVLIASDGILTDTLKVFVQIQPINDPPVITSSDSVSCTEGIHFTYRAAVYDIDSPHLTIKFINYPSWLSTSGPEISGTPPNKSQDTTFTVIASDELLSDTMVVNLTVIPVNDPPVFDYDLPKPSFYDVDSLAWEINLDNYVTDPDDPDSVLSWTYNLINTVNISISIDTTTHIAKIICTNILGKFLIAFTVTDPQNASATDTLQISIIKTGVESHKIADAPADFILYDNYPNPFNPRTTIRYGVPVPCQVSLRIFNILGQEVTTLVDEKHYPGMYEFQWDASSTPSGLYFYRIQAGKWHTIKQMVLLK